MSRLVRDLGFLAGVSAGIVAALVMLVARAFFGVLSPPELLIEPFTAVMPPELFELGLSTLGFAAKPLLVAGFLVLQVLIAGFVGSIYGHLRALDTSGDRVGLFDAALLTLGVSAVAWILFLPVVGEGPFGTESPTGALGTVLATLVTNGAFAGTLVYNLRQLRANERVPAGEASVADRQRRRMLGQIAVGGTLVAAGGALYRSGSQTSASTGSTSTVVPSAEMDRSIPAVTSNDEFYTVSKNFVDPIVDVSSWRLEVTGLVEQPLSLTYAEVLALPAREEYYTLCCISNEVGGDLIGNALWKGVPLKTLLDKAGVKPGVRKVIFHGADDYQDSVTWEIASRESNFLAWEMNGEQLPNGHGFPVRLLIPNIYGMKNVKWLTKIELVDYDFKGFWQQRGWSDEAVIQTMSRIDAPERGDTVPAGQVRARGIAFAGDRGVQRVEVSFDDGQTWVPAVLDQPLSPYSWVIWTAEWPAAPGRSTLQVRAVDGTGALQTSEEAPPLPDGSTGYHRLVVRVAEPS